MPPDGFSGPIHVYDVNGDGKPDPICTAGHRFGIYWMENLGGGMRGAYLVSMNSNDPSD